MNYMYLNIISAYLAFLYAFTYTYRKKAANSLQKRLLPPVNVLEGEYGSWKGGEDFWKER
jgi:hypothetical protein